jgi:hypothetical protein
MARKHNAVKATERSASNKIVANSSDFEMRMRA